MDSGRLKIIFSISYFVFRWDAKNSNLILAIRMDKYGKVVRYDKLVRDKIPEIIKAKGKQCKTHVAENAEYVEKLKQKLLEEVHEYLESGDVEELADIKEVLLALYEIENISEIKIEEMRKRKFVERGGFSKKIILEEA